MVPWADIGSEEPAGILENFSFFIVSISSLTGECAAEKLKKNCSSSLWTFLHHMVILRSQNKITDFFMILAWASPFNSLFLSQRYSY